MFSLRIIACTIFISSSYACTQSIITQHERQELGLDEVITTCNRSITRFGLEGLRALSSPIDNLAELQMRQKRIKLLVSAGSIQSQITSLLSDIAPVQDVILEYLSEKNALHAHAQKFYFKIPVLHTYLNENQYALTIGYLYKATHVVQKLLKKLLLYGVIKEWYSWIEGPDKEVFDIKRALIDRGIGSVIHQHKWQLSIEDLPAYKVKHLFKSETIKDLYTVLSRGYDTSDIAWLPEALRGSAYLHSPLALAVASIFTLSKDCFVAYEAYKSFKSFLSITRLVQRLKHRCVELTHFFNTVEQLAQVLSSIGQPYAQLADDIASILHHTNIADCIALSQDSMFCSDSSSYLLSYGKVLKLHHAMSCAQEQLYLLIEKIGFVDGYISLARLYQDTLNTDHPFTFVEFIEDQMPIIEVSNAWLPTIGSEVVCNDIRSGKGLWTQNMIITGPNGGGKSVYEKLQGLVVVLAQSWGIVPAESARQTIFNKVCTGLNPQEDLSKGLSKFMAQKLRMSQLQEIILNANSDNKVLVLVDEPYNGTVDDVTAERICDFCLSVYTNPYALITIATHVLKPTELEKVTQGIFKNYHVGIIPNKNDSFTRTFKLQEGIADWWFSDTQFRSNYIDWIAVSLYEQESVL